MFKTVAKYFAKLTFYCALFAILLVISIERTVAQSYSFNDGYVLVLTSYTYDSQRVTDFIAGFDKASSELNLKFGAKIENMSYRGLNECNEWHKLMSEVLERQDLDKLRAIILLGQEAWAVYISLKTQLPDVPFYGCFISRYGVVLPEYIEDYRHWHPTSVDTRIIADSRGRSGGVMNDYDIESNIRLVRMFYPGVKSIAFLSDNTYGGISLQAAFKHVMRESFPDLVPVLLDGRVDAVESIHAKINELPENSVLLLGAWRVDKDGSYFMNKIIPELVDSRPQLPIFTVSGVGLESVAIGGYIPNYSHDVKFIIEDINRYYSGNDDGKSFFINDNHYMFRLNNLRKHGLKDFNLPVGSKIVDSSDVKLQQYQNYFMVQFVLIIISAAALVFFVILFLRLRHANAKLKKQSMELDRARKDAEKSDKLKSAFLANMSHEIRTPLNAIVGFSSLMIGATPEQQEEYSQVINTNNNILLKLISEIIDFSKIESGLIELCYQKFNVSEHMRELKKTLSLSAPSNVDFVCEVPYSSCHINYDKDRLSQVVTNLVTNSFKFTSKGRVVMGFKIEKQGIRLYVSDTGIGIAKENYEKVFQRFEKLNTFAQGAGLGLAVCKAIVEKSGGTISLHSELGKGTIFNVEIPCEFAFEEDHQADIASLGSDEQLEQSSAMKVLVAEDNDSNYLLIKSILTNFNLTRVSNGSDAVEALRISWFDLVLMDIKMPVLDGLEATKKIRKFDTTTPILALTAFAYESDRKKALDAGCNDFISKPLTKNKLYSAIEKLM